MSSLRFGTSGLRGLIQDIVGVPSRAYSFAYLKHLASTTRPPMAIREVVIGRDLRSSSQRIADDCAAAASFFGAQPVDCGELPTPALALEAQRRGCPAIMVTGSHIPDDRNGLKFYRPDGEITKADESGIIAARGALSQAELASLRDCGARRCKSVAAADAVDAYVTRYVEFFGREALQGLVVGVYQHSTVARDILTRVLGDLGAESFSFGRAGGFVPVDTEAHRPEDVALIAEWAGRNPFDAIVSADGDADRPLIADGSGQILRGDVVGLLTAAQLDMRTVVTPITSGSFIERSGLASQVIRTRVGSPYVLEGMAKASESGGGGVIGFEANGGVLMGADASRGGRVLAALPTRDALLPILSVLSSVAETRQPLRAIVANLKPGCVHADRLTAVPKEIAAQFLDCLGNDKGFAKSHFQPVGCVSAVDCMDGVKTLLDDGSIVHYRASGNAPELRCYVEARQQERSIELLNWGLTAANRALKHLA